jgi:dynein heavy chain
MWPFRYKETMAHTDSMIKYHLESTFKVINDVYLPLEKSNDEIKLLLEKYSSVISQSIAQVTGSKSINFPAKLEHYFGQSEEPPFRVMEEFRQFLVSLTDDLKGKLDLEVRSRPDEKLSLLIIEFWRAKSTNLYTLFQELSKPEIGMLKSILLRSSDENSRTLSVAAIDNFDAQIKELIKCSSEAKDNVKFLNTLERQFKNLQSNDFSVIEKTLPSLLKGLKVVFIISRHFKSDNKISSLLVTISTELCNKVQGLLNVESIFQDIKNNPDENFLEELKTKIVHGRTILHQWKTLFEKTKEKLEEEGGDRWDFDQKPIKERPEHMIKVLESFRDVIDELKKFVVLLGPRLKAVTGNTDRIDELISKVKNLSNTFISLSFDCYDKNNWQKLRPKLNEYNSSTKEIQEKTIKLIETTFADLRSSESAFELLQKFINLQSLDHISEQLHRRYSNVLTTYQKELALNKELFEKGRNASFYAKNQPPVSGAIRWKREIMHRIKTPILKFIKRSEEWNPEEMKLVKEEYKGFAKQLDAYEKEKLDGWVRNANERAIRFLKEKILVQKGKYSFVVNFPEEFKVLINEAKHLDSLGYQLPKTILNIALQEKEYFKYAEKLGKMVEEYHAVVNSLSDIEQYLYSAQLKELTSNLNPVVNSFNLNTLGIYDFIANYKEHLKHFVEMKNKVDEKKRMIEDILATIEGAQFIDETHFERVFFPKPLPSGEMPELDSLAKFYSVFEAEIEGTVGKLTEKYRKINETMLPQIEFTIFKKQTGANPSMRFYYQYWERRIYNSVTKMIVRALLCLKTILSRPHHRPVPIFKVQTEFHYMKVITVPHQNEIRVTLNNLLKLVKDSAVHFPRWRPNTCIAFSKADEGFEGEERMNFTFLRDINDNTVIKLLTVEISEIKKLAFSRLEKHKSIWEEDKGDYQDMYSNFKRIIWNQKNKFKIDKILEKNPLTSNFEFFIDYFNSFLKDFEEQPNEVSASFILVDFSNVKQSYIAQCKEALTRIGNALLKIADKRTAELAKQIHNYNRMIDQEAETLQELKAYLNLLTEIRDSTMEFEFKLEDLEERYQLLIKYDLSVNLEVYERMKELKGSWNGLLRKVFATDKALKEKKQGFADQTTLQVKDLQEEVAELHKDYFKRGPGSVEISLENGQKALNDFSERLEEIGRRKAELVTSQKLFNLEISSFPKLVEVEEDLKGLAQLYSLNADYESFLDKYSKFLWAKVDFGTLDSGKKKYTQSLKKFGHSNQNVLAKIKLKIEDFSRMLPIFEKLKCDNSFKDYHWEKLLNEIGYAAQDVNFKAITLQNVFDFKLQDHMAKVDEIVNMSVQEGNNEDIIKGIETFWKNTALETVEYKKQNEKKGFVVKVSEDVSLTLNDHLINLQNMEGSKYAQALKQTIKQWVVSLNTIMETVEVWISVQRKWMYLESIFIGNEDMRQQLPKEAKTFENLHRTFKKINEQAVKNPNVYVNCVQIESTLPQLKTLALDFDKSQKSLSDYLNSKKVCFPRFYFISDDDLLSILGSSECTAITPHLMKLYDNCKALNIENNKVIKGMTSEESESYEFKEPVKPEGAVEVWMSRVEAEMVRTLKDIMKEGVFNFAKVEKKKWIMKYLGMAVLAGVQIWWTWRVEDAFRKVHEGSKYALKAELERQSGDLKDLIDLVRSDLESADPKGLARKKINTLIIIEVHQRDIVDRFVRDSILDIKEFGWESQLRFYWQQHLNDMQIFQCAGRFSYGYEYQGLNGRLVITPLTDRCVMTLTTALSFNLGGAPAGPAGTGKTETCKDLAKSLATRCIVTNCGENFDSFAMGNNFSGLCQTGFWGCFDEFNRINPDVLSVVSAQIKNIQNALNAGKKTVSLMNQDLSLVATIGIFVTMNPGYEGRSELPDNLKALFRPVVMVVPDNNIICENMLMSEGFVNARVLAKKMTVLYKLSREQLSKQYHYDFGLRALKSVLVMAGSLKRSSPDVPEDQVLMRALRDMNLPKFVNEDITLFLGLINDLFPNLQIDSVSRKDLQLQVEQTVAANGLTVNDRQVSKVIQLFETMLTRHTTMIVGPTSVGKSAIIEVLQKAQSVPGVSNVTIYPINPKAQTLLELYGDMDIQTRDWTDGILSKVFKVANEESEDEGHRKVKEFKWIVLDGDVDAVWIENMNSVMDDNKLLTLSNGDRIRLKPTCKLLFEVFDLQFASPATISRCGMVYVDETCLDLSDFYARWVKQFATRQFESEDNVVDLLKEMFKKYVPPLVDYLFNGRTPAKEMESPLRFIAERTPLNLLAQLTNFFNVMMPESVKAVDANSIEGMFVFCLVWSFGACLVSADRERFAKAVRDLSSILLPNFSLFEGFYDMRDHAMLSWDYKLSEEAVPTNVPITRVLIPTTDTVKYNYLLREFESNGLPVILVGDSGTAKTVIIENYLKRLDSENRAVMNMNFSSRTNSLEVQRNIENMCDKRRPGLYCPKGNKKLLVFIDELHMPQKDKYNTQQPIAMLRFLIEKGIMYERGGHLEKRKYYDINFASALLPHAAGYNKIDPRFLSLFNVIGVVFPDQSNVEKIYNTILTGILDKFPKEVREMGSRITAATLQLYNLVTARLPRTPIKFHYVFNLRDLSKVYMGLAKANLQFTSQPIQVARLWRNECVRIFSDRLMTVEDLAFVTKEAMAQVVADNFDKATAEGILGGDTVFCEFMDCNPVEPGFESAKLYKEVESLAEVKAKVEDMLETYNTEYSGKEMNLVVFSDAVEHLVRLMRVLSFQRGHAMLVGFGGSGKQSLTRLASFIIGYGLFSISFKRNYKESNFKEDLLDMFLHQFASFRPLVFMLTDVQISEESFLELVNTVLTVGVVSSLFDEGAKNEVKNGFREMCKRETGRENGEEIWEFYGEFVRNNLHVVLCMSPAGESLRVRSRNFPGLVSSTSIDWFFSWPAEALNDVASHYLRDFGLETDAREKIQRHMVWVHSGMPSLAVDFFKRTGRNVYSTPKNFLDFLNNFKRFFDDTRKSMDSTIVRYETGLDKLTESAEKIGVLRVSIGEEKVKVEVEKKAVEELLQVINEKTAVATEKQTMAKEKQDQLAVENLEIKRSREEADQILSEKLPALEVARQKVSEIKKTELDYIRALPSPPKLIQTTVTCLQILRVNSNANENEGWSGAKAMLSDSSLVNQLIEYSRDENKISKVTAKQIKLVDEKLKSINEELTEKQKTMLDVSPACAKLLFWVDAVKLLYDTNQIIKPLKEKVERLTREKAKKEEALLETTELLRELNEELGGLNQKKSVKEKVLFELTEKVNAMEAKLFKAEHLIADLEGERVRWGRDKLKLADKLKYLHSSVLLGLVLRVLLRPFRPGLSQADVRRVQGRPARQRSAARRGVPRGDPPVQRGGGVRLELPRPSLRRAVGAERHPDHPSQPVPPVRGPSAAGHHLAEEEGREEPGGHFLQRRGQLRPLAGDLSQVQEGAVGGERQRDDRPPDRPDFGEELHRQGGAQVRQVGQRGDRVLREGVPAVHGHPTAEPPLLPRDLRQVLGHQLQRHLQRPQGAAAE